MTAEFSLSPDGERFPLPGADDYPIEFDRLQRLAAEQRELGRCAWLADEPVQRHRAGRRPELPPAATVSDRVQNIGDFASTGLSPGR